MGLEHTARRARSSRAVARACATISGVAPALRGGATISGVAPALRGGATFARLVLVLASSCGSGVDDDACVAPLPAALINAGPAPSYLQLNPAQASAIVAIGVMRDHELWRLCTGTLIAPRVVLTAAHCANGADRLSVRFGLN